MFENSLLLSENAESGAKNLIERIRNGALSMDKEPDMSVRFSNKKTDCVSFGGFLKSYSGQLVMDMVFGKESTIYN